MAGELIGFQGYERDTLMFGMMLKSASVNVSRNTSVVDPLGGIASCRIAQISANNECFQSLPIVVQREGSAITGAFEGERWGFLLRVKLAIDPTAAAANYQIMRLIFSDRTITLCARTSDGMPEWFQNTSSPFNGEGSAIGTAGSVAVDDEWHSYWIDVNVPVSGNATITAYLDFMPSATCSPDTSATSSFAAGAGGRTGATAPGDFLYSDNVVSVRGIDGSESGGAQWHGVVLATGPNANGDAAWQDFGVVNTGGDTQHYQAVDEQAPDSNDYVFVNNGQASADEYEHCSAISTPSEFPVPLGIAGMLSDVNNGGGKWAANHVLSVGWDGTTTRSMATLPDPSTGYQTRAGMTRRGRLMDRITLTDIDEMQIGVSLGANVNDTAMWVIRTFAAEVLFARAYLPPPLLRPRMAQPIHYAFDR